MRIVFTVYLCSLLVAQGACAHNLTKDIFALLNTGYDHKKVKIVKELNRDKSKKIINIIVDDKKNYFIIKQASPDMPEYQAVLLGVKETLAAYIAECHNLPVNRVRLISADMRIADKIGNGDIGTLHAFIPGIQAASLQLEDFLYDQKLLFIQQPMKNSFARTEWGLTRRVVKNMSCHADLAAIVAFDTFIANIDRHRANFLYDKNSDRFFAIDLSCSFSKNLALYACNLIESMIGSNDDISVAELKGLSIYRDVLKMLIAHHSPKSMYKKIVELVDQVVSASAGMKEKDLLWRKITLLKPKIKKNYASCKRLVILLDQLIIKYTQKKI